MEIGLRRAGFEPTTFPRVIWGGKKKAPLPGGADPKRYAGCLTPRHTCKLDL